MNEAWEERYSRQIILPGFGKSAQEKLRDSSVLVVGCGGLGCPVLLYLVTMGVGHITLVDHDRVELSNLPRQVLYRESDIGQFKAEAAANHLRSHNGHVRIHALPIHLGAAEVRELVRAHDVVVDASDNFPTRFLLNDACVLEGKVLIHGAAGGFDGQVSTFNVPLPEGGRGPNYRDLFPLMPDPGSVPSCAEAGVLGVVPGIIGQLQAAQVVKYLTGVGELLIGELLLFDAWRNQFHRMRFAKNPSVLITDSDIRQAAEVIELDWEEWERRYRERADALIDVRETGERDWVYPGSEHLPMSEFADWFESLEPGKTYAFYCFSGKRSAEAIDRIARKGFEGTLIQLMGGAVAYLRQEHDEV
ncbi:MAG: HesA/MoeB/ThiF family protein [Flavobacteriales bacterium]|nr:HesA/MoeB/ThiF family protein [Flavobacteriales bacterium]